MKTLTSTEVLSGSGRLVEKSLKKKLFSIDVTVENGRLLSVTRTLVDQTGQSLVFGKTHDSPIKRSGLSGMESDKNDKDFLLSSRHV